MFYFLFPVIFFLLIPSVADRINEIMYLKLLVQILGVTFFGTIMGLVTQKKIKILDSHSGAVIFLIGTLTFWMIPRSVDFTVQHYYALVIMLCNLLFAGFFLGVNLKHMAFVLKMALGIYGLSMFLTMGIIYYGYQSLLCAVYTVEMQNLTGKILLQIFPFLFVFLIYRLFKNLTAQPPVTGG